MKYFLTRLLAVLMNGALGSLWLHFAVSPTLNLPLDYLQSFQVSFFLCLLLEFIRFDVEYNND